MRHVDLFGPILIWEMTRVSRRERYFILRMLYALLLFLMLWSSYQSLLGGGNFFANNLSPVKRMSYFANSFFASFGMIQLAAVLFLTPAYVASSIVIEKERRTIEYLFASTLTNFEIVVGKWLARVLNVAMLVLAGVPILGFAAFFGGISTDRIALLAIISLASLLSAGSVAILVSVYGRGTRQTLSQTYLFILLLLLAPLFVTAMGEAIPAVSETLGVRPPLEIPYLVEIEEFLYSCEPFVAFQRLTSVTSTGDAVLGTAILVGVHLAIAGLCLGWSIARLRAAYRVEVGGAVKARRTMPWNRPRRASPVRDNPMAWKEWNFGARGRRTLSLWIGRIILFLSIYYAVLHMLYLKFLDPRNFSADMVNVYARFMSTLSLGAVLILIATRAATSIAGERDKDSWVTLLSTPLTPREIIGGKLLGAMQPLYYWALLSAPAWLLAVYLDGVSLAALPVVAVVILVYALFVAALGLYLSLRRSTTGSALAFTFGICIFLGGFGQSLLGLFFVPLAMMGVGSATLSMLYATSVPWFILGAAPFRTHEIMSTSLEGEFVLFGVLWILAYAFAALQLYLASLRGFDRWSGRVTRESPPPVPTMTPRGQVS